MQKIFLITFLITACNSFSQNIMAPLKVGAEQTQIYIPQLIGKKIALVVNQTSMIGKTHLVDSMISSGIVIKKIFAPEHGFRGNEDAGADIQNLIDSKTKIPVVSIYGKKLAPDSVDLADVDEVIFDIQDVGCRFYTYISTLQYVMESCAKSKKPLLIFDRPNPNGFYVDGPVLEKKYASFVGMQSIPTVYGLTIGEYAMMLNGEHWLKDSLVCELKIVPCTNYSHKTMYRLPVNPSPNLTSMTAIYLYPTLCFFEGTQVSVGRGTDKPFQVVGYPFNTNGKYLFTPKSKPGATSPMYMNKECKGFDLSYYNTGYFVNKSSLFLSYLIDFYNSYYDKQNFFTNFFDQLAGTDALRKQIVGGKTEAEIRFSWKKELNDYKIIRKKYLLYEDFE
jgi:uncharacterized protein YbbC (DUF1343 family)